MPRSHLLSMLRVSSLPARLTDSAPTSVLLVAAGFLLYIGNVVRHLNAPWDDAYITYRFSEHLAQGRGLVWNVGGDRVEGFTSFLHVILLAAGTYLGRPPEWLSLRLGIGAVVVTLVLLVWSSVALADRLSTGAAAVIAMYLADDATAIHSTSGLETQLFSALLAGMWLSACFWIHKPTCRTSTCFAVLVVLSALCRPEGVLFGGVLLCGLGVLSWTRPARHEYRLRATAQLIAASSLVILLGGTYAAWKYSYFGYLLPNPYYVKSDRLSFSGYRYVGTFVLHLSLHFLPVLAVVALVYGARSWLSRDQSRAAVALAVAASAVGLVYYSTIIHEVGGAFRFCYPILVLLAAASAIICTPSDTSLERSVSVRTSRLLVGAVAIVALSVSQPSWRFSPSPIPDFNAYHFRIAAALSNTGLKSRATVLCDAAGVIPYLSGFSHIDRVGLTDNFLSGRTRHTPAEREEYLWSRGADVYIGYEPPASRDARGPTEDVAMESYYVKTVLLRHKLRLIEDRIFVQEPSLLHARMRRLRDDWVLVGEIDWPGVRLWKLKSFVYIHKESQYRELLHQELVKLITRLPGEISLEDDVRAAGQRDVAR